MSPRSCVGVLLLVTCAHAQEPEPEPNLPRAQPVAEPLQLSPSTEPATPQAETEVFGDLRQRLADECDNGSGRACADLGLTAEQGKHGPADRTLALAAYQRACKLGEVNGCSWGGLLHLSDATSPQSRQSAIDLLSEACRLGDSKACGAVEEIRKATRPTMQPVTAEPFPKSVAGFPFDATRQEVAKICKKAGGEMVTDRGGSACTAVPVDPFFTIEVVTFRFCNVKGSDRLCEIFVFLKDESGNEVPRVRKMLEGKYGPMTAHEPLIHCQYPSQQAHEMRGSWAWVAEAEGKRSPLGYLQITNECTPDSGLRLMLVYRSPPGVLRMLAEGDKRRANY